MPSRVTFREDGLLPQWPLSEVDTEAYSLDYKINPDDHRWLNFKLNLWHNDTTTEQYSTGGQINQVLGGTDSIYTYCHPDENASAATISFNNFMCSRYSSDRDTSKAYLIENTAYSYAENTRTGANFSNQFKLTDGLDLTLGADLSYEKLETTDEYVNTSGYRALPRAGRRSENQYWFNFAWQATPWLSLTAGAKSVNYWSFDDYLNESSGGTYTVTKEVGKWIIYTEEVEEYTQEIYEQERESYLFYADMTGANSSNRQGWEDTFSNKLASDGTAVVSNFVYWAADPETGQYHADNNPLLNGTVDINQVNVQVRNGDENIYLESQYETISEPVKKKKDHKNWAPSFSAAFKLNDNNRLYVNYSEAYRLPSLFETTLGFSASQSGYGVKPEHAHNWEVAYIYNLKPRLKLKQGHADIKLAYFNNRTEDVIERNSKLVFTNVDEQKIAGWELSTRLDTGRYFGDLALVWNKQNRVCDESSTLLLTRENSIGKTTPSSYCTDYGFPAGYLINMALPEYQVNFMLGTRLLDKKLELGTRITYFEGFKHPYIGYTDIAWFNAPLQWNDTWLIDAYAHYKYSAHLSMDLVGTNLGNRYYLDPLSRSSVPAPGRTFKLALTYKF